jgi:hypothetical protein
MRGVLLGSLLLVVSGCAAAAPPPAAPPPPPAPTVTASATAQAPPPPPPDPFAIPEKLRPEPAAFLSPPQASAPLPLPPAPRGIRGPDRACAAFARRKGPKAPACADRAAALGALDTALAEGNTEKRDGQLASLEACAGLPAGLVRALRAELAPVACGDALAEPLLARAPKDLTPQLQHVLVGYTLAGRLARMGGDLPQLKAPFTRERVLEHIKGPIVKWLLTHTSAIEETSQTGAKLSSYARGVVAVEAGMADLRLVVSAREVPLPKEFDEELRAVYFSALDEVLDPRKIRGRDAALVGLSELAATGVISDPRLDRVRAFLSRQYKGRRIDALDPLALPPRFAAGSATLEERLATRLPTFYASVLLDPAQASSPPLIRALLERGIPASFRRALEEHPPEGDALRAYARARVELGRRYMRALDFDQAIALIARWPQAQARPDDLTFLLALSLALRNGPESASALLHRPASVSLGLGDVSALDSIAAGKHAAALSPQAAYDAATIQFISPPEKADAAYWRAVAARLKSAAAKDTDPARKLHAEDDAKEAESIAKFLEEPPKPQ